MKDRTVRQAASRRDSGPPALISVMLLLIALGGCFTLPEGEGPDLSSPERALEYLEESYINRDPGGAILLLHDDFVYYFNENEIGDVIDGRVTPQSWNNYSEERFIEKLLLAENSIHLDLETESAPPPDGEHPQSDYLHYSLDVVTDSGEHYHAEGEAQFRFAYDDDYGWLIDTWNDYAAPGETSWSTIRMLFRYR